MPDILQTIGGMAFTVLVVAIVLVTLLGKWKRSNDDFGIDCGEGDDD